LEFITVTIIRLNFQNVSVIIFTFFTPHNYKRGHVKIIIDFNNIRTNLSVMEFGTDV